MVGNACGLHSGFGDCIEYILLMECGASVERGNNGDDGAHRTLKADHCSSMCPTFFGIVSSAAPLQSLVTHITWPFVPVRLRRPKRVAAFLIKFDGSSSITTQSSVEK